MSYDSYWIDLGKTWKITINRPWKRKPRHVLICMLQVIVFLGNSSEGSMFSEVKVPGVFSRHDRQRLWTKVDVKRKRPCKFDVFFVWKRGSLYYFLISYMYDMQYFYYIYCYSELHHSNHRRVGWIDFSWHFMDVMTWFRGSRGASSIIMRPWFGANKRVQSRFQGSSSGTTLTDEHWKNNTTLGKIFGQHDVSSIQRIIYQHFQKKTWKNVSKGWSWSNSKHPKCINLPTFH